MLLFGISVFQWSVAPVGMARALDQSLRRASKVAAIVLFATAIAWLLLAAAVLPALLGKRAAAEHRRRHALEP